MRMLVPAQCGRELTRYLGLDGAPSTITAPPPRHPSVDRECCAPSVRRST
jgi:hypothetical protein